MTVSSNITATTATASADIQYRPQDVGTNGKRVRLRRRPGDDREGRQGREGDAHRLREGRGRQGGRAGGLRARAAQRVGATGRRSSASPLQAFVTGVLSAQGAAVTVINGVPTVNIGGATFYVGYGPSGALDAQRRPQPQRGRRCPGAKECKPQAPQTGLVVVPAGGRARLLDRGARATTSSSRRSSTTSPAARSGTSPRARCRSTGSLFTGDLLYARGGQTLFGAYPGALDARERRARSRSPSTTRRTGTLVWPGGTVPIERFNIVPNGLNLAPVAGPAGERLVVEPGGERAAGSSSSGRAATSTSPATCTTTRATPCGISRRGRSAAPTRAHFTGNWWSFGGGQTLTGPWKPNTPPSDNFAPVTIQFNGPDKATMTLPNGRIANLYRHRF